MYKAPGNIIILHLCITKDNQIMFVPEIWSSTDRIFCHFGQLLALLPSNIPENENFEEIKNDI